MLDRHTYATKFGNHLRALRESKGLTLRELALEMDSDKPTLSKIENGKMVPTVYFLSRICLALKVSETDFFKNL